MCVADLSADSLKKARELLAQCALSGRADFRVGDGLTVLPRPAQAIAILGMGGRTLSDILVNGKECLHDAALILSAHTDMPLVRKTLMDLGYFIDNEAISRTAGRFYVLLRAVPGQEVLNEKKLCLGPRLTESNLPNYPEFLEWRIALASKKQSDEGKRELQWLREEYERVCHCKDGGRNAE